MAGNSLFFFIIVVVGCAVAGAAGGSLIGSRRIRGAFMGAVVGLAAGTALASSGLFKGTTERTPGEIAVGTPGSVHLAIDHLNLAVRDVDLAAAEYEALGFTIKPGRVHENSIDNRHMKFGDATELELITAKQPKDQLAIEYLQHIRHGEGPAFLACRTSDFDATTAVWEGHGLKLRYGMSHLTRSATIAPGQPLRPVWLLDKPEPEVDERKYIEHENTAKGIRAVWYAPYFRNELVSFCASMNFSPKAAKHPPATEEIEIDDGYAFLVVDLPMPVKLRPVIGVSIAVDDIQKVESILARNNITVERSATAENPAVLLPPTVTRGVWLELREYTD